MAKAKIVMLPLDERPCNFDYPRMMPKTDCELILPPKEIMGKKKTPGDVKKIADWLTDHVHEADAMILSLDTLVYGGILPSRLHHCNEEELVERLAIIHRLRAVNPKMKLYAFGLIMRCPTYSSNDEEPDYYEQIGAELHLFGKYTHLEMLGKLSDADRADFDRVKAVVGERELADYVGRRRTNLSVLMRALEFVRDGEIDYFLVPQDDAAVYGFTSMDQMTVRTFLKENILHKRTAMYPSADDTGLTLLARAVAELSGIRPKVYVHYASSKGGMTVPQFEDRIVAETVKYHILSINGIQVYSLPEADILLAVNIGSQMVDKGDPNYVTAYDIERNLAEFVNFMEYALDMGKTVAVADVAWPNTADTELTRLMQKEDLMLRIHAYAGWNTSSNTTGTALCQAVLYMVGGDRGGNCEFLLHRYYEDIGYMAHARQVVAETHLARLGLHYRGVDGTDGQVAELVKREICAYMEINYPELAARVEQISIRIPWARMFETDLKLNSFACREN